MILLWQLFWISVFIITIPLMVIVIYGIIKEWGSVFFGVFWFVSLFFFTVSLAVIVSILLNSMDWTSWNAFWSSEVCP